MTDRKPPQRIAADPSHPWYDPEWVPWVRIRLGGIALSNVVVADAIDGWVELYPDPPVYEGGVRKTVRVKGEVEVTDGRKETA